MARIKKSDLTIPEIRQILLRHEGTISALAGELDVRPAAVSQMLTERMASKRILAAARARAELLLREEGRAGSVA